MTRFLISLVKFYRRWLSPLKSPCCRFVPTCSAYALEALQKYGWARGSLLTLKRIVRCNPFCKGGYDPVP
ncbi:MAG: membrane protein insertion efficiency factor YidD [Selenomonadaceae bacterium]|nr:membrane protein insertion efficiency factor YidD [Selenomonadaceae bacterium]